MKLQKKFFTFFLAYLLIALILIFAVRQYSTNIVKEQIANNLVNTVLSKKQFIESVLDEYRELVKRASNEIDYNAIMGEELNDIQKKELINQWIKSTIESRSDIYQIRILNKSGIIIASNYEDVGEDKSTNDIFLKGKERIFIGDLHISEFTSKYIISVSSPILAREQVAGILVIDFDAEKELFKITDSRIGLGGTGEVYLVNKDGYIITPSRFTSDVILKQKVNLKHIAEIGYIEPFKPLAPDIIGLYKDFRDREVLGVCTYIPEMGWSLLAEIDQTEVFFPVVKMTYYLFLLTAIISVIGLFVARFSYENTVVPIIKLQKDTKELMNGNLNHEIAIARKDEIGDLSQTFNLMTLNLKKSWEKLEEYNKNLEEEVKEKTKDLTNVNEDLKLDIIKRKKTEKTLSQALKRNEKLAHELVDMVGRIVETRDPYTAGHQLKVSELATAIAREMKLTVDRIEGIRIASLIHDIGKVSIPAEILSNPIKLNEIESSLIKDHSQIGYDILKTIDFPWPVAQIIIQHHEKLDGSGYPQGLKGNKILLEAKIIGVADVVEAMSSHRPYRPTLGIDKALEEISQNRGILYDPEVVDTCLKLFREKKFKF